MEGVGNRLGRSSTRYGAGASPAVFSGPVRKWKKKWVNISPSTTLTNKNKPISKPHSNPRIDNSLSLFKWTKTCDDDDEDDDLPPTRKFRYFPWTKTGVEEDEEDHPPTRKIRYFPIAKLEEQKQEAEYNIFADQFKPNTTSFNTPMSKSNKAASEEKPDINDVPMYENQGRGGKIARHDLNEGTFDLSLG